jgi:LPXTG-site transpeptidase (sortase) family protein
MTEKNTHFQFKLKKRNPLWRDLLLFAVSVGCFWGGAHIALNYSAYSQIAEFKLEQVQEKSFASTVEAKPVKKQKKEKQTELLQAVVLPREKMFKNANLKPKNQAKTVFRNMPIYPSDNRLYIPSLNKNVPLITVPHHKNWNQLENNIQKGLQDGVVVHPVSREPEKSGNFFLTGHSSYYAWDQGRYKDVFALLHEMETGEKVELYWEGKKYTYLMKVKEVVSPTATQILKQPDDAKIITLMTCTPIGTNKNRLVLMGEQIENEKQS